MRISKSLSWSISDNTIFLVGEFMLPKFPLNLKFPLPSFSKILFGALSFPTATSRSPSLSKSPNSVE